MAHEYIIVKAGDLLPKASKDKTPIILTNNEMLFFVSLFFWNNRN